MPLLPLSLPLPLPTLLIPGSALSLTFERRGPAQTDSARSEGRLDPETGGLLRSATTATRVVRGVQCKVAVCAVDRCSLQRE